MFNRQVLHCGSIYLVLHSVDSVSALLTCCVCVCVSVSQKSYSRNGSSHTQDASFQFHLSPQQIQSITASRFDPHASPCASFYDMCTVELVKTLLEFKFY